MARGGLHRGPDADGRIPVAWSDRVTPGHPVQVEARGTTIALFRAEDGVHAVANACLHEDGPLAEGRQDGFIVRCPYHDWRYDVRDGRCLTLKGRRLATWEVREYDGIVWIGENVDPGTTARGGEHDDGLKSV